MSMRFCAMQYFLFPLLLVLGGEVISSAEDAHSLSRIGSNMDAAEIAELEQQIVKNPVDVESRTKILGYYFITGRREPNAKSARQRHVRWLIENAPESEVLGTPYAQINHILDPQGYKSVKQAWEKLLQNSPENKTALRSAARFFLQSDRGFAEKLLLRGKQLDTGNPEWPASLGQLYALGLIGIPVGPARKATAEKALEQYRQAYQLSSPRKQSVLLDELAKCALEAGVIEEARGYAEEMLADDAASWNRGNRVHHGNLILGRIALTEGDIDEAKSRLLLAGKTEGSPQLNSFGPNMQLAKELIEKGEQKVVLEYFDLCKKFWKSPRRKIEQWIEEVKASRIPDFGGNLAY